MKHKILCILAVLVVLVVLIIPLVPLEVEADIGGGRLNIREEGYERTFKMGDD